MSNKDRVLVYSDDPKDQLKMSGALERAEKTKAVQGQIEKNQFCAVFRIEKNGRGGKTVTVIDQLPNSDDFLKSLTKELKAKCGVGGSYRIENSKGYIEIQGDKREAIKKIFDTKSIKYKGV